MAMARRREQRELRLCVERECKCNRRGKEGERQGSLWRLAPIASKLEDVEGVRNSINACGGVDVG